MLILRVTFPLKIPILDRANDVRFVRSAELNFDFVPSVAVFFLEKKVQAPAGRLYPLLVTAIDFPRPSNEG